MEWHDKRRLRPIPDPIDFEGHGTHVSDIIAGQSTDGAHKGVAPDAKIVAVKVCSSVSTACSGLALLQGMEFALDPNGDGSMADAVDVINMSLGSNYGQKEDECFGFTTAPPRGRSGRRLGGKRCRPPLHPRLALERT